MESPQTARLQHQHSPAAPSPPTGARILWWSLKILAREKLERFLLMSFLGFTGHRGTIPQETEPRRNVLVAALVGVTVQGGRVEGKGWTGRVLSGPRARK